MSLLHLRTALASLRYRELYSLPRPLLRSMRQSLQVLRPVRKNGRIFLHLYAPPTGGESYRQYLRGLRRMSRGERIPLVAHLAITDACHCRCSRCSNYRTGNEPSTRDLRSDIEALREAGCSLIGFTGGEPLLRDDVSELIASCQPDIGTLIYTTGHGLDAAKAHALRSVGLDMLYISLDHFDSQQHDRTRQYEGAHSEAVSAIRASVAAGLFTGVQTVVERDLLQDDRMRQHLERLGSEGVDDVMLLEPVDVCGQSKRDETDTARTCEFASRWHRESLNDSSLPRVTASSLMESNACFGCQGGFSFVYINTAGDVCPCDFAHRSFGNIRKDGLPVVLERLKGSVPGPCAACPAGNGSSGDLPQAWPESHAWAQSLDRSARPAFMNWLPLSLPKTPSGRETKNGTAGPIRRQSGTQVI